MFVSLFTCTCTGISLLVLGFSLFFFFFFFFFVLVFFIVHPTNQRFFFFIVIIINIKKKVCTYRVTSFPALLLIFFFERLS